jgi:hypothetical protein
MRLLQVWWARPSIIRPMVVVADDAGDAADELGVHEPEEPPLEWLPEPPHPG